jgi:4-hydroxy-2-oxoheptanedioate aldolase
MKLQFSTGDLKNLMKPEGRGAFGTWLHCPSGVSAEVMCGVGCDFLVVDLQHSVTGFEAAVDMIRIGTLCSVPILVRLTGLDAQQAGRVLDAGACGVICPVINNEAEARELVAACRYPPYGQRSMGPFRPRMLWADDYVDRANDHVIVFAMIETKDGLDNINQIAAVDGLDGLFAGPNDIALAINEQPMLDPTNSHVRKQLRAINASASKFNKIAGIACETASFAREMIDWGYRFNIIASDLKFMTRGAEQSFKEMRKNDEQAN